jgi:translation initiation factor 2D
MFKKPLGDTKTSGISLPIPNDTLILISPPFSLAPLRSSERRKLRAHTAERFRLASEIAENLVPDGLLSQKFSNYNGEPGVSVQSLQC